MPTRVGMEVEGIGGGKNSITPSSDYQLLIKFILQNAVFSSAILVLDS